MCAEKIQLSAPRAADQHAILSACKETFERHRKALPFAFHEQAFEDFYTLYISACFEGADRTGYAIDGVIQAAYIEDALAGYVILSESRSPGKGLEIFDIYVFPEFCSRGIGRKLVEWCKMRASETKAHNLDATVWSLGDDRAIFFGKCGLEPVYSKFRYGADVPPPPITPHTEDKGSLLNLKSNLTDYRVLWVAILALSIVALWK